ncbi:MAG: hypothetical protein ACXWE5_13175 [Actinomycetota bacterium]
MNDERERDPQAGDLGDRRPKAGGGEADDTVGQVQAASWKSSTYRSSRTLTPIPGSTSRPARRGSKKAAEPGGQHRKDDGEEGTLDPPSDGR